MALRFVILEHTVNGESHFDLMMELDPAIDLHTLQLQSWPPPCDFKVLALHRRAYLDYEGEVSNNRGAVKRILSGTWQPADDAAILGEFTPADKSPFKLTRDGRRLSKLPI
ncbi:hypothetical protein OAU50_06245 [Planctomycetota bacterium]|nr:hypothetical protein [Planctomycetota bacterium]